MKSLLITVELLDGDPFGTRRAKIQHRQARAIALPRNLSARMPDYDEFSKPGIYFLVGRVPAGPTIYVGQTDQLSERLKTHRSKDWDVAVAITSSDDWMDITIARTLESRCWHSCQDNRFYVLNNQEPKEPQVRAQDLPFIEEFFEHMVCLTRALGFDFLGGTQPTSPVAVTARSRVGRASDTEPHPAPPSPPAKSKAGNDSPKGPASAVEVRCVRCDRASAGLIARRGEFVLEAGTHLRPLRPSAIEQDPVVGKRREKAVKDGLVKRIGTDLVTIEDITFTSPSLAGGFVLGGATNGWICWKTADGRPLSEWREQLDTRGKT